MLDNHTCTLHKHKLINCKESKSFFYVGNGKLTEAINHTDWMLCRAEYGINNSVVPVDTQNY